MFNFKRFIPIIVIMSMACMTWVGVAYARGENGRPEKTARVTRVRVEPLTTIASDSFETETPKPTKTASSSGILIPTETPVAASSAFSPSPTPDTRSLGQKIVDFFKGSAPKVPPDNSAGLNTLSIGGRASLYDASFGPQKAWYGIIGLLALLGVSAFIYGRSKRNG